MWGWVRVIGALALLGMAACAEDEGALAPNARRIAAIEPSHGEREGLMEAWTAKPSAATLNAPRAAVSYGIQASGSVGTIVGSVTTLAGAHGPGFTDGASSSAAFKEPFGVAVDGAGNVYVADTDNNAIRAIIGGQVYTLAGAASAGFVNGTLKKSRFDSPMGVALDSAGDLIIADTGNNAIRAITTTGQVITVAGDGNAGWKDGATGTARFNAPRGVAVDPNGVIWVADTLNHCIRAIVGTQVITVAGSRVKGYRDAVATASMFAEPWGIDSDSSGSIYVADTLNHRIRRIDTRWVVTTLAGGSDVYRDGTGAEAGFGYPIGLAVERGTTTPNVFVTDLFHRCIRVVSSDGVVTTYAGDLIGGDRDGVGAQVSFGNLHGAAWAPFGALYLADGKNDTIRQVVPVQAP